MTDLRGNGLQMYRKSVLSDPSLCWRCSFHCYFVLLWFLMHWNLTFHRMPRILPWLRWSHLRVGRQDLHVPLQSENGRVDHCWPEFCCNHHRAYQDVYVPLYSENGSVSIVIRHNLHDLLRPTAVKETKSQKSTTVHAVSCAQKQDH